MIRTDHIDVVVSNLTLGIAWITTTTTSTQETFGKAPKVKTGLGLRQTSILGIQQDCCHTLARSAHECKRSEDKFHFLFSL